MNEYQHDLDSRMSVEKLLTHLKGFGKIISCNVHDFEIKVFH